jgi:hypothetical protein
MERSGIDLPKPEGPHRTIFSPARTVKLTSFNTLNEPHHLPALQLDHRTNVWRTFRT